MTEAANGYRVSSAFWADLRPPACARLLPAAEHADGGVIEDADVGGEQAPSAGCRTGPGRRGGAVVVRVALRWGLFGGDLGDGGAGGGLVDDGLVCCECRDEGLDGEVVHCAGIAAAGLVDHAAASSENSVSDRPASPTWWRR